MITDNDKSVLRELGAQVAEIAELTVHEQTRTLWKRINGLDQQRPMVSIDQIPWQEINVNDELTLQTTDDFARSLEGNLRRTLYRWKHIRADMVVEKFIDVPKAIRDTGYGIRTDEEAASYDPNNPVKGHRYFDQIQTEEDIQKIKTPQISCDWDLTAARESEAKEVFDGILGVRMTGVTLDFKPWDLLVQWHGVEDSIIDLVDRPEFTHKMLRRFTDAATSKLDQIEEQGLLGYDIPTIHCAGAYTDELPSANFDPEHPKACDTWTMGMAQIFATVSPAMHDEFEIEYAIPWYDRFGLGYYGCCEPLHDKIDIIDRLPRVRKVSISPWADVPVAAERMAGKYVMSRKPNPAFLATETFNPDTVRRDLEETRDAAAKEGCAVEFILKDISTVKYDPERLWEWEDIARSVVGG